MRASFASAACLFLFTHLSHSVRADAGAANSHQQPIVAVAVAAQEGVLRRYPALSSCVEDSERKYWQSSASYATDVCHDLNPRLTESVVIATPAICANGTRATLVVFSFSGCSGASPVNPARPTIVSDKLLGTCLDVDKKWSFAFVCDGVESVEGGSGLLILAVMVGVTLLGLGLGTAALCCGSSVVFFGGLGLLTWGFWTLGRMCLGIYTLPEEVLPVEEGEEGKEKPEEKVE